MLGLCLLIPMRKFGKVRNWFISAFAVGIAWGMAMYLVNSQVIATYAAATEADSYVAWAGETGFSMSLLIHDPVLLVRMFYQTLLWNAKDMHITMIGGWLGNLDQVLDVPYLAVWAFTLCLIGLALKIPGEQIRMNMRQRVWTGFFMRGLRGSYHAVHADCLDSGKLPGNPGCAGAVFPAISAGTPAGSEKSDGGFDKG